VAICDQLEDPKLAKGIVKRGVTEMVTPELPFRINFEHRSNNFLAALHYGEDVQGISFLIFLRGVFHYGRRDGIY
jgi:DNA mismatch repair protein MutS